MNPQLFSVRTAIVVLCTAMWLPLAALGQNLATVNGKTIPNARVDSLLQQAANAGQDIEQLRGRVKEEVVSREIFAQEAERKGLNASAEFRVQVELAIQALLVRELFEDFKRTNPVTDVVAKAEYDRLKALSSGTEYRARHILVEREDEAKALIRRLKGGASFEALAKTHSKDTGSAGSGGDLDFAKADAYVPEFGGAITNMKIGELTDTPVKTQFGYHIIKLEDVRANVFPSFAEVKVQLVQNMLKTKLQQYQTDLRNAAKTDYKFRSQ